MNTFRAVVIGPADRPAIADDERILPALSVLTAIQQARQRSPTAAATAFGAVRLLPRMSGDRSEVYFDVIQKALKPAARRELEKMLDLKNYRYESDFAKKYIAKGIAKGKAEGIVEGERNALLAVLRARGFVVTRQIQSRIVKCKDATVLHAWVMRAAAAASIDAVF